MFRCLLKTVLWYLLMSLIFFILPIFINFLINLFKIPKHSRLQNFFLMFDECSTLSKHIHRYICYFIWLKSNASSISSAPQGPKSQSFAFRRFLACIHPPFFSTPAPGAASSSSSNGRVQAKRILLFYTKKRKHWKFRLLLVFASYFTFLCFILEANNQMAFPLFFQPPLLSQFSN